MNSRLKTASLIAVVIAVPAIIIGLEPLIKTFVSTLGEPRKDQSGSNTTKGPPTTLQEARQRAAKRLAKLQSMTTAQYELERKSDPRKPPTLDIAIAKNQAIVKRLYDVTQEQWDALGVQVEAEKRQMTTPAEDLHEKTKQILFPTEPEQ